VYTLGSADGFEIKGVAGKAIRKALKRRLAIREARSE
jgi:hypothetical protein